MNREEWTAPKEWSLLKESGCIHGAGSGGLTREGSIDPTYYIDDDLGLT